MDKTCARCQQLYPLELDRCPGCGMPCAREQVSVAASTDTEVDLGAPVGNPGDAPASGASLVAWSELLRARRKLGGDASDERGIQFDPISEASSLVKDAPPPGEGESNEIDLGSPVDGDNPAKSSGPLSGASFVAWSSLLRQKAQINPGDRTPVRFDDFTPPVSPAGVPIRPSLVPGNDSRLIPVEPLSAPALPTSPVIDWRQAAFVGFICGTLLWIVLWLAGLHPPDSWRTKISGWFTKSPSTPTQSYPDR